MNREKRKVKRGTGKGTGNDMGLPSDALFYCGAQAKECR